MRIEKYGIGTIGYGIKYYYGSGRDCFTSHFTLTEESPSTSPSQISNGPGREPNNIISLVVFDKDTNSWREYFTGETLETDSSSLDQLKLCNIREMNVTQFQESLAKYSKQTIGQIVSSIRKMKSDAKVFGKEYQKAVQDLKTERSKKESNIQSVEAKVAAGFGSGYQAQAHVARKHTVLVVFTVIYWLCIIAVGALIAYECFGPNKSVPKYLSFINDTLLKLYIAAGVAALCAGFLCGKAVLCDRLLGAGKKVIDKTEISALMGLSMFVVGIGAAIFVYMFSGYNYSLTVNFNSSHGFAFTRLGIYAAAVLVPFGIGYLIGRCGKKH